MTYLFFKGLDALKQLRTLRYQKIPVANISPQGFTEWNVTKLISQCSFSKVSTDNSQTAAVSYSLLPTVLGHAWSYPKNAQKVNAIYPEFFPLFATAQQNHAISHNMVIKLRSILVGSFSMSM